MVEHQRSIMALMGIDLWIPKSGVETRVYNSTSLYRDQAEPEISSDLSFASLDLESKTLQNSEDLHLKHDQSQIQNHDLSLRVQPLEKTQHALEKSIQTPITAASSYSEISLDAKSALQIEAFELQALSFEHCVIVTNATTLTQEQAMLWRNIQSAVNGQLIELKWPFALLPLQDGRGASIYVKGFLDAISSDKRMIFLGTLPYILEHSSIELASLQEMLDEPISKRKLWEMMQK